MRSVSFIVLVLLFSCTSRLPEKEKPVRDQDPKTNIPSLIILGTIQDGGSPHPGCKKKCCENLFSDPDKKRKVVSLGLVDPANGKNYLFEATPDLPSQLRALKNYSSFKTGDLPDGILLSHAHIGHYTGLMYLGKEAMNTDCVSVYVMPRMKTYLETNGPWNQLVKLNNVELRVLDAGKEVRLTSSIKVTPFLVPHRDEYSETVGYRIVGPNKKVLFIPDIDKWDKWDKNISEEIIEADYVFIDGTFYSGEEIQNRDISKIPHPFVTESIERFKTLTSAQKDKIYFIHFNHTNPLLDPQSFQSRELIKDGFHSALPGQIFSL